MGPKPKVSRRRRRRRRLQLAGFLQMCCLWLLSPSTHSREKHFRSKKLKYHPLLHTIPRSWSTSHELSHIPSPLAKFPGSAWASCILTLRNTPPVIQTEKNSTRLSFMHCRPYISVGMFKAVELNGNLESRECKHNTHDPSRARMPMRRSSTYYWSPIRLTKELYATCYNITSFTPIQTWTKESIHHEPWNTCHRCSGEGPSLCAVLGSVNLQ